MRDCSRFDGPPPARRFSTTPWARTRIPRPGRGPRPRRSKINALKAEVPAPRPTSDRHHAEVAAGRNHRPGSERPVALAQSLSSCSTAKIPRHRHSLAEAHRSHRDMRRFVHDPIPFPRSTWPSGHHGKLYGGPCTGCSAGPADQIRVSRRSRPTSAAPAARIPVGNPARSRTSSRWWRTRGNASARRRRHFRRPLRGPAAELIQFAAAIPPYDVLGSRPAARATSNLQSAKRPIKNPLATASPTARTGQDPLPAGALHRHLQPDCGTRRITR